MDAARRQPDRGSRAASRNRGCARRSAPSVEGPSLQARVRDHDGEHGHRSPARKLACTLDQPGGPDLRVAGNYYGVTHPSQPNYIAATAGTTQGVPNDNDVTVDLPNIVDQLESHHKSWKGYMQAYSLCATKFDHACGNQLYERKHNPFVS
jgi:hypothetical protein